MSDAIKQWAEQCAINAPPTTSTLTDSQLAEWERKNRERIAPEYEIGVLIAEVRRLREERGLDLKAGADALLETMTERNQLSQQLAAALDALRERMDTCPCEWNKRVEPVEQYGGEEHWPPLRKPCELCRKAAAILENANAK